ncbi:MAG: hypothetical protein K0R72_245 [Clostridia bacterium]|jgi:hypothetical protein|nr:hypothetical protein [Clostridia bacterium]
MDKDNNLDLAKAKQRREELEVVLKWKIVPKLNLKDEYRLTIAYDNDSSKQINIKVLGSYIGEEINSKILEFFDSFLNRVNSFGLLVESRNNDDVKNWDITFSEIH